MKLILKNAKIILENKIINNGWIEIKNKKITAVNSGNTALAGINLRDAIIMPGFIDCHVHGGYGVDFETGTVNSFDFFAKKVAQEGVTKFCQATVTNSVEKLKKILYEYSLYMKNYNFGQKAIQIGAHLEGPFISHEFKGAHEEKLLLKPDIKLMQELIDISNDNIRIVTYAPELQDGTFTKFLISNNIIPSMGHSAATYEQVINEVKLGANHFTHLHNGMSRYDHRHPGMTNAGLYNDKILCEIISDNIHNNVNVLAGTFKIKTADHLCIITDAMMAKGLADGKYKLGNLDVIKQNDTVTLLNGTLAGSAATYNINVKKMKLASECSWTDLIKMTSVNVAHQLGIYSETGSIAPGKLADLVVVNEQFDILLTICEGEIAYQHI